MPNTNEINEVKAKLTLTEVGVIVSLVASFTTAVFTAGIIYAQVNQNTAAIDEMKPKVEANQKRLERIDANVEFLAELAKEDRTSR